MVAGTTRFARSATFAVDVDAMKGRPRNWSHDVRVACMSLGLVLGCRPAAGPTPPGPSVEPATATQEQPATSPEPAKAPEPATAPEENPVVADAKPAESQPPEEPPAETVPEPKEEPKDDRRAHCPDIGEKAFVYSIGSSTLASLLGPMIEQTVKRRWPEAGVRKWGKASSGLARPDFHDWISEVPSVNEEYDPDVYIVSLGTNDFQSLWVPDGWVKAHTPEWEKAYGDRVEKLLEQLSGGDRKRLIVWVGPSAFNKRNARQIGPKVNRVIKERIKAFDGNAFYVDAFTTTSPKRGTYIKTVRYKGKDVPAYGPDGIHLSAAAVHLLMARPLFKFVAPCLDP